MGERIWAYSLEDEALEGPFDTRDEAVRHGMGHAREEESPVLRVHECAWYRPEIDAGLVIDRLIEDAGWNYDYEAVEYHEWLYHVTDEDEALLGEMLNDALREWLRRTGNEPHFMVVEGTEEIGVPE